MSADAVGYTRLMAADEVATMEMLNSYRGVIAGLVRQHGGRVVDMVGDNLLAEFPSAVDAVQCALEVQEQLAGHNMELPDHQRMLFRIGINVGDLIVDGERIVGGGVNIAARIEATAEPGGVAISGSVLDQIEGKIKVEICDLGEHDLKNVPRPVHIFSVGCDHPSSVPLKTSDGVSKGVEKNVPGFAGRHAIAVLPFRNLSQDEEQEYFADGLAEDLITSLAALRIYPVISRNSSFTFKNKTADARQIGSQLGAHYVVAGSVRKAGERMRVSAELIHAVDGHQIWSGRYDRNVSDIFDLQDELTVAIAGAVGPALSQMEIRHAMRRQPQNLDAWECVHRSQWHLFQYSREDTEQAHKWASKALDLQPDLSMAYTLIAFSHMYEVNYQYTDDPAAATEKATQAANRAVALDKNDAMALVAQGFAASIAKRFNQAVPALEEAIRVNPSSAMAYWALGVAMTRIGRPDDGIPMIEKAVRLSPQDPLMPEFVFALGAANFVAERYEEAVKFAKESIRLRASQPGAYRLLSAAYGHLGEVEQARPALEQMRKLAPGFSEAYLKSFLPDSVVAAYMEGLRLAGWQDA